MAISWEIQILNFIKIAKRFQIQEFVVRSKFALFFFFFFCLICIFWHCCRNSFGLKMFLLILGHIEILQWKFCIWRAINGCFPKYSKLRLSGQFQACLFIYLFFYGKISRTKKAPKCKTSDFHPLRSLCAQKTVALVV